jgi:UDP-glucose 4-epimerase
VTWLLTGGAGYIGSHIALALRAAGTEVVVLDDLSTGYREYVPEGVELVEGSVTDPAAVARALARDVTGVVHLAGYKYAGESVKDPLHCYRQNVTGMQVLLEEVVRHGVQRLVFSSSAACYGTPDSELVTEDAPTRPESPYGESKLISEWLLRRVGAAMPELRHVSLRYFNVVGSGPPQLADRSPYALFPLVFRALQDGRRPVVFGDDYPTPDGTCVRDYIDVTDLAEAHVAAVRRLDEGGGCAELYNVGRGEGISVAQIMDAMRAGTGIAFEPERGPRRPGDPSRVVASPARIERDLGWTATRNVETMVSSAWAAWQHPAARG